MSPRRYLRQGAPDIVETRTGIRIGSAYVPKRQLAGITRSEEVVQQLLLAKAPPRRRPIADVAFVLALGVGIACLLAWALSR